MKNLLHCKDLYAFIEGDKAKLTGTSNDDCKKDKLNNYWYDLTMVG